MGWVYDTPHAGRKKTYGDEGPKPRMRQDRMVVQSLRIEAESMALEAGRVVVDFAEQILAHRYILRGWVIATRNNGCTLWKARIHILLFLFHEMFFKSLNQCNYFSKKK